MNLDVTVQPIATLNHVELFEHWEEIITSLAFLGPLRSLSDVISLWSHLPYRLQAHLNPHPLLSVIWNQQRDRQHSHSTLQTLNLVHLSSKRFKRCCFLPGEFNSSMHSKLKVHLLCVSRQFVSLRMSFFWIEMYFNANLKWCTSAPCSQNEYYNSKRLILKNYPDKKIYFTKTKKFLIILPKPFFLHLL